MSEISSGLVAVRIDTDGYQLVRLSDAEAIIAQKDAEILDQCRLNGMGAEREAALRGLIERLNRENNELGARIGREINIENKQQAEMIEKQSAALKLAREALTEVQDLIGESSGVYGLHLNGDESPWSEVEQGGRFERLTTLPEALAAINEVLKGE